MYRGADKYYTNYNFQDTTTANLYVDVAGGLCDELIGNATIQFQIRRSGQAEGNVVEVRSPSPITEPFVTFLVEASWARGRLLREYTVILDPPTFTPPAAQQPAPAETAPKRSTMVSRLGGAPFSWLSKAVRMARICSGVVPQHPPMIRAPLS